MKPELDELGLKTDNMMDNVLASYTYNDGLYGLPYDSSVFAYAYNKDIFDEAGRIIQIQTTHILMMNS